ncbi:MAG: substrate-binding domain-containing protein, partial [Hyphomicrobiales bacterium]
VIADDIENPYFAEFFKAIYTAVGDPTLMPMLLSSDGSVKRQSRLLQNLGDLGCAGAILVPANGSGQETLDLIKTLQMPVVLGNRHLGFGAFDYVGPNFFQGMQMATQHLLDLGHRRLAFVGGESQNTAYTERLGGFRVTISNAAAKDVQVSEIQGPPTHQFGVESMSAMIAMQHPPTAIIAYNDLLAFGLMSGARDAGLTPGKDIAIVGFDDVRGAAQRNVPLTTVSTPPSRIGLEAARLLKARIDDASAEPVNIIPPPVLMIRQSCGAPGALTDMPASVSGLQDHDNRSN